MGKQVLFLAPKVANIYLDVIEELKRQGYEVDYYEYKSYKLDPHYLKGYVKYGRFFTSKMISSYLMKRDWKRMLSSPQFDKIYDYLFVIDGYSLHPYLFDTLRNRNSKIKAVNYLFDSTYSNYEFDVHFPYFDKVATFDLKDSKKFGIDLLPIFYPNYSQINVNQDIDLFGLGSDIGVRFHLFTLLDEYSKRNNLNSHIRIYHRPVNNFNRYKWKYRLVEALSSQKVMTPPEHFNSPIITGKSMSTSDYQKMILRSKIIIDSNAPHQDGLTARFMWALGAERKIVTTNKAIKEYDFYTPEQIYVIEDIETFLKTKDFANFLYSPYKMSKRVRNLIGRYRIDNWINFLFM